MGRPHFQTHPNTPNFLGDVSLNYIPLFVGSQLLLAKSQVHTSDPGPLDLPALFLTELTKSTRRFGLRSLLDLGTEEAHMFHANDDMMYTCIN